LFIPGWQTIKAGAAMQESRKYQPEGAKIKRIKTGSKPGGHNLFYLPGMFC